MSIFQMPDGRIVSEKEGLSWMFQNVKDDLVNQIEFSLQARCGGVFPEVDELLDEFEKRAKELSL